MINSNGILYGIIIVLLFIGTLMAYLVDVKEKEIKQLKMERYYTEKIVSSKDFECTQLFLKEKLKNERNRTKATVVDYHGGNHSITF